MGSGVRAKKDFRDLPVDGRSSVGVFGLKNDCLEEDFSVVGLSSVGVFGLKNDCLDTDRDLGLSVRGISSVGVFGLKNDCLEEDFPVVGLSSVGVFGLKNDCLEADLLFGPSVAGISSVGVFGLKNDCLEVDLLFGLSSLGVFGLNKDCLLDFEVEGRSGSVIISGFSCCGGKKNSLRDESMEGLRSDGELLSNSEVDVFASDFADSSVFSVKLDEAFES